MDYDEYKERALDKKVFSLRVTRFQRKVCILTATFFETGTYATPTKLQNLTILGLGDPDSTQ